MSLMKSDRTKAPKSDRIAGYAITPGAGEVYDGPADLPTTYNNYPEQLSASILLSIFSREFKPSATRSERVTRTEHQRMFLERAREFCARMSAPQWG